MMKEKTNKQKLFSTIVFVIVVIAAANIGYRFVSSRQGGVDKQLMERASAYNKNMPIMVDKDTRLDNLNAMPKKMLQYNYTLINWVKDSINVQSFKDYITPHVINQLKTNPEAKFFKENNISIAYSYSDKDGNFVCKIDIKPDMYKE